MNAFLLTWNPRKWPWDDIEDDIAQISEHGVCIGRWSAGVTKRIYSGDRIFLMRLGAEPRGIVASGIAVSGVVSDTHWGDDGKSALYVDVDFDTILNPEFDTIFPLDALRHGIYLKVHWTPQVSGMSIPVDVAEELETDWNRFLSDGQEAQSSIFAGEIPPNSKFFEGALKEVRVNKYERSSRARALCIKAHGTQCAVCGFDFEETFGEIGAGFIHVHHLLPIASIREGYSVDPARDLRPVCPNCHAMLHRRGPEPYSIDELRSIIRDQM